MPPRPCPTTSTTPAPGGAPVGNRLGAGHADWAAHARSAEPAVAVRVLGEVLLVVVLGVVVLARVGDLGRDLAVPGGGEALGVDVARGLGGRALRVRAHVDAGAVLRAHVVALAHA